MNANAATQQPAEPGVTQKAFAALINVRPSYVTALKQADRLVMTDDNRRVLVDESIARIDATKDPAKCGTVERFVAQRGPTGIVVAPAPSESSQSPMSSAVESPATDADLEAPIDLPSFAESKASREYWMSLKARREYEQVVGSLADVAGLRYAGTQAGMLIRTTLETLADRLGIELAPITDADQVTAVLIENIEEMLTRIADEIERTMKAIENTP